MAFNLAVLLGFMVVTFATLTLILLFGRLLRPNNPYPLKNTTYECAEVPEGTAWFNFNNRFYIIALVFVAFDVEIALVVPVVVVFRKMVANGMGALAFAEIFFFLFVLFVALIYVWAHGDLNWDRVIKSPEKDKKEVVS